MSTSVSHIVRRVPTLCIVGVMLMLSSATVFGQDLSPHVRIGQSRQGDVFLRFSSESGTGGFRSDRSLAVAPTRNEFVTLDVVQPGLDPGLFHQVEGYTLSLGGQKLAPSSTIPGSWTLPAERFAGSGDLPLVVQDPLKRTVYDSAVHRLPPGVPRASSGSSAARSAGQAAGDVGSSAGSANRDGSAGGLVQCGQGEKPCTLQELFGLGARIFNWLLATGGAVALLAIIWAGLKYILAVFQGADSSAIAGAKQSILYALIGLVVLLGAFVIVRTILSVLDVSPGRLQSPPPEIQQLIPSGGR